MVWEIHVQLPEAGVEVKKQIIDVPKGQVVLGEDIRDRIDTLLFCVSCNEFAILI